MNIGPSDPIDHTDITQGSDLSGMDLTGVDLTSADLSEAYLSNVILAGADLSNADLSGADLTDTTLAGADLSNATLTGADLSNAGLSGADLSDADLINTDLTDATLRGVDLSNATFAGADLTGADLTGTDLSQGKSADQKKSDELLTILQSLYDQLDRVPKSTELPENSKYSPHDFYTGFGSWDEALKAAGIDKKQALLEDLNQVAEEVGHVPKTSDVNKHGTYSYSVYLSYFDSWDEALQQSGIKERFETESRESSEEMINTLQSLYNQLDRVPKPTELPEKYSPSDFSREFGSWNKALKAAGIDKKQAILDEIEKLLEIRGVWRPTARRILEAFGTVDEATSAPTHELTEIRGVGQGIAARITSKTGRQTGPDHDQPTTTAKSETSPEKKDNDSIEILDKIANEFEEL